MTTSYYATPIANGSNLVLEGNFNDYFDVLCESGQEREATQVLAPNIMQKLMQLDSKIDVELSGNSLYLYYAECNQWTNFGICIDLLMAAADHIEPSFSKAAVLNEVSFGKNAQFATSPPARRTLVWSRLAPLLIYPFLYILILYVPAVRPYSQNLILVGAVGYVAYLFYRRRNLK